MKAANETSMRYRIAHLIWIGNATVGGCIALLGGLFAGATFSRNMSVVIFGANLSALTASALAVAVGVVAAAFATWRVRETSVVYAARLAQQQALAAQPVR